jgi:hypothetical protein
MPPSSPEEARDRNCPQQAAGSARDAWENSGGVNT